MPPGEKEPKLVISYQGENKGKKGRNTDLLLSHRNSAVSAHSCSVRTHHHYCKSRSADRYTRHTEVAAVAVDSYFLHYTLHIHLGYYRSHSLLHLGCNLHPDCTPRRNSSYLLVAQSGEVRIGVGGGAEDRAGGSML